MIRNGLFSCCTCTYQTPVNLARPGLGDARDLPAAREIRAAITAVSRVSGYAQPISVLLDSAESCHMCIGRAWDGRTVLMASTGFIEESFYSYGKPALWGAIFHEVGHARSGHLIAPAADFGGQWPREIGSDIFAQRILVLLGMDPEPFAQMLDGFGHDVSETHPAGTVRAATARDAARLEAANQAARR